MSNEFIQFWRNLTLSKYFRSKFFPLSSKTEKQTFHDRDLTMWEESGTFRCHETLEKSSLEPNKGWLKLVTAWENSPKTNRDSYTSDLKTQLMNRRYLGEQQRRNKNLLYWFVFTMSRIIYAAIASKTKWHSHNFEKYKVAPEQVQLN